VNLLLSLAAALSFSIPLRPTEHVCTWGRSWFPARDVINRPFLAKATGDSMFIGEFFMGDRGVQPTRPHAYATSHRVYGQIVKVTRISPSNSRFKRGEKVVLVWWGHGAGCEQRPPGKALIADPGTELFISLPDTAAGPRRQGLRTLNAFSRHRRPSAVYSPQFVDSVLRFNSDSTLVNLMTAGEFFDFYVRLPLISRTHPANSRLVAFVRWSETRPDLSNKFPACMIVATAEVNLSLGPFPVRQRCARRPGGHSNKR
jgi:hypothetical protein